MCVNLQPTSIFCLLLNYFLKRRLLSESDNVHIESRFEVDFKCDWVKSYNLQRVYFLYNLVKRTHLFLL